MYRLLRVYNDGTVIEGKVLYHIYHLDELLSLLNMIHPATFEFTLALEVDLDNSGR